MGASLEVGKHIKLADNWYLEPFAQMSALWVQGERYDPDGAYVRAWIPELAGLDNRSIHAPWTADDETLTEAGVALGKTYPRPIVDHAEARTRALAAFATLR